MELTPHQAKYFAQELTKRTANNNMQQFVPSLMDAKFEVCTHRDKLLTGVKTQFISRKLIFSSSENYITFSLNSYQVHFLFIK
jgi:hypothetical protein